MTDRNLAGCCILTDEPVRDITRVYSQGHPRAGEGAAFGEWHDNAYQVTLLLANSPNSKMMNVTVSKDALDDVPTSMVKMTEKVMAAYLMEYDCSGGGFNNNRLPTEEQKAMAMRTYAEFAANPPIGVLCVRPMKEV